MTEPECYCFLDTNIFLHFVPIDQIDWHGELREGRVALVLCVEVLRELDTKSKESTGQKIRKRAQRSLSRLRAVRDEGESPRPREGVDILFEYAEPQVDWSACGLDRDTPDDRIIASALSYKVTGRSVVVATDDFVMQGKATKASLDSHTPSDQWRLPDTETPEEKQTKERLRRLEELESALPCLSLQFATTEGETNRTRFNLEEVPALTDERIEGMLERKRAELRYSRPPDRTARISRLTGLAIPDPLESLRRHLDGPSEDQIRAYEKELDEYIRGQYRDYLTKRDAYERWKTRSVELAFLIVNDGAGTADDIDIFLTFPDAFELSDGFDVPAEPHAPDPAAKPRGRFEVIGLEAVRGLDRTLSALPPYISREHQVPRRATGPRIERTQSYEVGYWLRRLKQGMSYEFEPVWVTFAADQEPFSFHIDFRIITPSVPGDTTGELYVIAQAENTSDPG